MSFTRFLNEGLIKIPPKLEKEAGEFFKEQTLAYLLYKGMKQAGKDKDEQEYTTTVIKRAATAEGVTVPNWKMATKAGQSRALSTKLNVEDLATRYLDQLEKQYGNKKLVTGLKVKFTLAFTKHKDITGSEAGKYIYKSMKEPEVIVSIPNLGLEIGPKDYLSDMTLATIIKSIRNGMATIEHELSHVIQEHVLELLKSIEDIKAGEKSEETGSDAYYTSKAEFDPMVRSTIRAFRSEVERGQLEDRKQVRALFDSWIKTNKFLKALQNFDKLKWQKAIKLIWTEYEKRYL